MEEAGMKNKFSFESFKTSDTLVDALCSRIERELKEAIEENGVASIAFSGGSTPKKLLQKLSMADLPWYLVNVTLVDERWVDVSSRDSNENLLHENLLINRARNAQFISLKNAIVAPEDGWLVTNNRLKKIGKLDIVILGMGVDGHTASFFPHMKELEHVLSTDDYCCSATATVAPYSRLTLSRSFLLSAKSLILHIEGAVKKTVFELATKSDNWKMFPIISMMEQEKPLLEVYYA